MKFNRKWIIAAIVIGLIFVALSAFRKEGYALDSTQRIMMSNIFREADTRLTTQEQELLMKFIDISDPKNPDNVPSLWKPLIMNLYQKYPNLPQKMRGILGVNATNNIPSDSVGKRGMKQLINFKFDMKMGDGAFACYPS